MMKYELKHNNEEVSKSKQKSWHSKPSTSFLTRLVFPSAYKCLG